MIGRGEFHVAVDLASPVQWVSMFPRDSTVGQVEFDDGFSNNFVFEKSLQSIFDAVDWSCGGVDARSFCGKVAHVGDGERNISPKFRSNSRRDAWCKVISR